MTAGLVSDARRALEFVGEAASVTGTDAFPPTVLGALRELVPSTSVSWHEWSVEDGHVRISVSSEDPARTESVWAAYPRFRHEDPLPGGCSGAGPCPPRLVGVTVRLSDVVSRKAFRRSGLYAEICCPLGVDHVMKLFLPVRRGLARSVVFDRSGRDFAERERLVVDELRRHFLHLEEAARVRRLAAAMLDATEAPGELIVANAAGRLELATRRAQRVLRRYGCLSVQGRLATRFTLWLREPSTPSLAVDCGYGRLELCRLYGHAGAALAVEHAPSAESSSLTSRELQVMALVEEGRSNAEVAAALWLSPGTVRKHLENVYAKLGVQSRTAAVARLRTLDGDGPAA